MAIEPQHKIVTDSNTQLISLVFGLPIAGLAPYANVVLLIPSPDLGESVAILRQRNTLIINGMEANRFLITHPSNR